MTLRFHVKGVRKASKEITRNAPILVKRRLRGEFSNTFLVLLILIVKIERKLFPLRVVSYVNLICDVKRALAGCKNVFVNVPNIHFNQKHTS